MMMPVVSRAARRCANAARGLGYLLRGRLRRVPVSSLTSLAAFSFAADGWHYFTAAIDELERHPGLRPEGSVLTRFYEQFQPTAQEGFLPVHRSPSWRSTRQCYLPPWGGGKMVNPADRFEHWCGPKRPEDIAAIWEQLREAYLRLKRVGYRPWASTNGFIQVTRLVHRDGTFRCLVTQGHHRAAIVSRLGYQKIWVLLHRTGRQGYPRNMPDTVRLTEAASWPNVRNDRFSAEDAVAFFEAYFRFNGTERMPKPCSIETMPRVEAPVCR